MCKDKPPSGPSKEEQRRDIMRGSPFKSWDTGPSRRPDSRPFVTLPLLLVACMGGGGDSTENDGPRDRRGAQARYEGRHSGRTGRRGRLSFTALTLAILACGPKRPGGREEDDPMHHRLKREGRSLRDQLGLGGNGDDNGRRRMTALPAALTTAMALCWTQGTDKGSDRDGPVFRLFHFTTDAVDILTGPEKGGRFLAGRDLAGWARYVFLDDSPERHPFNCRYVRFLRSVRRLGIWPPA